MKRGHGRGKGVDKKSNYSRKRGGSRSMKLRKSRKDYPNGVLGIYDNGGKTADRYTVVYDPYEVEGGLIFPYLGMSAEPSHPQGFGQHGELTFRYTREPGERTIDFAELPKDCQKAVTQDLEEEGEVG